MTIENKREKTELKTSDFYYELPPELIAQHPSEKRDKSLESVVALAHTIEQNLRRHYEQEVPSKAIGEEALAMLKDFDQVAYIRFASVYRRFTDIQSFKKELDILSEQ